MPYVQNPAEKSRTVPKRKRGPGRLFAADREKVRYVTKAYSIGRLAQTKLRFQ